MSAGLIDPARLVPNQCLCSCVIANKDLRCILKIFQQSGMLKNKLKWWEWSFSSTKFIQKKVSKNKSPIFKPVHPVFKNASKPKWLEESRAGKIKKKTKTVVKKKKKSGLCFNILHLGLKNMAVARHAWPALEVPAEDAAIPTPLLTSC